MTARTRLAIPHSTMKLTPHDPNRTFGVTGGGNGPLIKRGQAQQSRSCDVSFDDLVGAGKN